MKSLNQLIVLSAALFQKDKSLDVFFVTEDGQFFIDENRANLHASDYKKKNAKELKVHTITKQMAKADIDAKAKKTEVKVDVTKKQTTK